MAIFKTTCFFFAWLRLVGQSIVPSSFTELVASHFSPNSSGASSSITLTGILDGDLSSVSVSAEDGSPNDSSSATPGGVDLASGSIEETDAADAFVYEIKFVGNSPVALDGEVVLPDLMLVVIH